MAALVMGCIIYDLNSGNHWGILSLLSICVIMACGEIKGLGKAHGYSIPLIPLTVSCLALMGWFAAQALNLIPLELQKIPGVALIIGMAFVWQSLSHLSKHGYADYTRHLGLGSFGLVYVGICGGMIFNLAVIEQPGNVSAGTQLVIMMICACKLGDVFAYFGGRAFGKHKLAPRVSPGKTWEGFFSAFFGAVVGTLFACWIIGMAVPEQSLALPELWQQIVWGLLLAPIGVVGDLVESCLKRDADVKDSSTAIPGFGGFLDLFDAVLFAAPVAYVLTLFLL